jgi:diacylglycerol O-acyltransferase / wax synthase
VSKKITFLDKTFWITETEDNPKHVASLQILQKPENANHDYLPKLFKELHANSNAKAPFNCRVRRFLGFPLKLVPVAQLDMDYHVQMHVIEDINDRQSLHKFVAELHEVWLERDKPLWQYHLISDNKSELFVIYVKVHHMYGDGATLIRWFQAGYTETIKTDEFVPVWAADRSVRQKLKVSLSKQILLGFWDLFITLKDLLWIIFRLLIKLLRINSNYMPLPFSGTKTVLTGQVKKGRVVSTVDIEFDRIKALSHRVRASANEVMLCVFDIGVHRFLKHYGHTFERALYTNMPINLRKPGETTAGNRIAIVPVQLAHGENDPYLRLRQIIENHRIVKRAARVSHPMAFSNYTILIQSYAMLFEFLHLSDWVKPIANILVSNLPGPAQTLYFKDCKLLANYPISAMTPGGGVNITMVSYAGNAHIGLVCCNKNIRSLESMSQYFIEAFNMLEACIDDPSLNIDDIGEQVIEDYSSIVEEPDLVQGSEK